MIKAVSLPHFNTDYLLIRDIHDEFAIHNLFQFPDIGLKI